MKVANEDYIGKMLQCTNPECREFIKIEREAPKSLPLAGRKSSPVLGKVIDATVVRARKSSDQISPTGRVLIWLGVGLIAILFCVVLWIYRAPETADKPQTVARHRQRLPLCLYAPLEKVQSAPRLALEFDATEELLD